MNGGTTTANGDTTTVNGVTTIANGVKEKEAELNGDAADGIKDAVKASPEEKPAKKESESTRKSRMRSIWIVHIGMFIFSLGFSIVLTGVFNYMKQLLPTKAAENKDDEGPLVQMYGWVVAANPLGQLIFSPVFGYICNRTGSVRLVCLVASVSYVFGNVIYSILSIFDEDLRFGLLMFCRFLIGVASANTTLMRAYVSSATYTHERTTQMSILSAAQMLGYVVGPALQAALTPIQCSTKIHEDHYIALDMYTVCGWVSVLFGMLSFVLFLPGIFVEFNVADEERQAFQAKAGITPGMALPRPDMLVMVVSITCYFIYQLNFVIIEAIGTPLVMDEFGWTESEAILYVGVAMACGGIVSLLCYVSVGKLAVRFDERLIQIFLGIFPLIIARLIMFPWPNQPHPPLPPQDDGLEPNPGSVSSFLSLLPRSDLDFRNIKCTEERGAPLCTHEWCEDQPAVTEAQFYIGFMLGFFGYPYCMAVCQAIFSKAIGPRPQGVWMGLLTASGSLARCMGPLMVSYIYEEFGLYATYGLILGTMIVSLGLTLVSYKRLVPFKMPGLNNGAAAGDAEDQSLGKLPLGVVLGMRRSIDSVRDY